MLSLQIKNTIILSYFLIADVTQKRCPIFCTETFNSELRSQNVMLIPFGKKNKNNFHSNFNAVFLHWNQPEWTEPLESLKPNLKCTHVCNLLPMSHLHIKQLSSVQNHGGHHMVSGCSHLVSQSHTIDRSIHCTYSCHCNNKLRKSCHPTMKVHGPLVAQEKTKTNKTIIISHSITMHDVNNPDLSQQMWHDTSSWRNVGEKTQHWMAVNFTESSQKPCAVMCWTEKTQQAQVHKPPEMVNNRTTVCIKLPFLNYTGFSDKEHKFYESYWWEKSDPSVDTS